jgi:hypothetical protein
MSSRPLHARRWGPNLCYQRNRRPLYRYYPSIIKRNPMHQTSNKTLQEWVPSDQGNCLEQQHNTGAKSLQNLDSSFNIWTFCFIYWLTTFVLSRFQQKQFNIFALSLTNSSPFLDPFSPDGVSTELHRTIWCSFWQNCSQVETSSHNSPFANLTISRSHKLGFIGFD